jgi:probable rRNA maturation factor
MGVIIELNNESGRSSVPASTDFEHWSDAVLEYLKQDDKHYELGIRLVNEEGSAELNENYRHKEGPTNVLSFAYTDIPAQTGSHLLGDLAICVPVLEREAAQQKKPLQAHWAHLTVHGMLHLLGYDHQQDAQAEEMEQLEGVILANLGYADPYHIQHD